MRERTITLGLYLLTAICGVIDTTNFLAHPVPDVATNVMTLTLVRLLSNWSIVGGTNACWQFRVASLAIFFLGAILGAVLVRFGPAPGLWVATLGYLVALPLLLFGRSPHETSTTSPSENP